MSQRLPTVTAKQLVKVLERAGPAKLANVCSMRSRFALEPLRCLASIMGVRGRDVTAHALNEWGTPSYEAGWR